MGTEIEEESAPGRVSLGCTYIDSPCNVAKDCPNACGEAKLSPKDPACYPNPGLDGIITCCCKKI